MMQIVQADSQKENILVLINHEVNHDNSQVFDRNEHKTSLSLALHVGSLGYGSHKWVRGVLFVLGVFFV